MLHAVLISRNPVRNLVWLKNATPLQFMAGIEVVLNLLAPNVPDRYFEFAGNRQPLAWSGVVEGSHLRVVDEWQDVAVTIDAPGAIHLWGCADRDGIGIRGGIRTRVSGLANPGGLARGNGSLGQMERENNPARNGSRQASVKREN